MFFVFLAAFLLLFLGIEILQRYAFKKLQWSRKATHIGSGFILICMPVYLTKNEIILLSCLFVLILLVSKYKKTLSLHNVERRTIGEVLYPASIAIIALICLPTHVIAFQIACMSLAFSDGLAAVGGQLFPIKQFKIGDSSKSIGGSITFTITTLVIMFCFPHYDLSNWEYKISIAIGLSVVEFFLIWGLDNLAIPVLMAVLLYFLNIN